jgi:hypothetical protein
MAMVLSHTTDMQKQVVLVSLRTVRARRRATAHHLKIFIDII